MNGRAFLATANLLLNVPCEENWRTVVGRAYYALLHEGQVALERWGFPLPPAEGLHNFVRCRFAFPVNPDMRKVSEALNKLSPVRNEADYRLRNSSRFGTDAEAVRAIDRAEEAIDLLDEMGADPARRAAAIAAIRAAFP